MKNLDEYIADLKKTINYYLNQYRLANSNYIELNKLYNNRLSPTSGGFKFGTDKENFELNTRLIQYKALAYDIKNLINIYLEEILSMSSMPNNERSFNPIIILDEINKLKLQDKIK